MRAPEARPKARVEVRRPLDLDGTRNVFVGYEDEDTEGNMVLIAKRADGSEELVSPGAEAPLFCRFTEDEWAALVKWCVEEWRDEAAYEPLEVLTAEGHVVPEAALSVITKLVDLVERLLAPVPYVFSREYGGGVPVEAPTSRSASELLHKAFEAGYAAGRAGLTLDSEFARWYGEYMRRGE